MPSLTFNDLSPQPDPAAALAFLDAWHGGTPGEGFTSIVLIDADRPRHIESIAQPFHDVREVAATNDLDDLIHLRDARWNVYHGVGALKAKPDRGRGKRDDVGHLPGIWSDLDCKDGSFTSEAEIFDFLASLPVQPTITVATGTGGVHAYWRWSSPVPVEATETLCTRWWVLLQRLAGDRLIDKVSDATRILRLPGTVRWPKAIDERTSLVRLVSVDGPATSATEIEALTEDAWQDHTAELVRDRAGLEHQQWRAADVVSNLTGWGRLVALSTLESWFNESFSWDQVLIPHGWTLVGHDDDGRRHWSRPGAEGRKAATTDWPASPHVMSLFSTAAETRLAGLRQLVPALTKYRVHCQLAWDGDETAFVQALVKELGGEA